VTTPDMVRSSRTRRAGARALRDRLRALGRGDEGFTLIETLMSLTLLATVMAPLIGVLMAAGVTQSLSRERTLAQQTAVAQVESIRALPYASVGTVDGNPPGTVPATRRVGLTGLVADVLTRVSYVNDPTPTAYVTNADYKKVTVTVLRSSDTKLLAKETTYVAPPGRAPYAGVNDAIVRAQVIDYVLNTPVAGATVTLGTGPSAPRNDATDAGGIALFPALTANPATGSQSYYDITTSLLGYQTLRDDISPAAAAHSRVAPGQTFTTVLRVYRPATISIALRDAAGSPYAGASTVTVASARAAQAFPVTGGSLTVTQIGGEPVVPGLRYTVAAQTPSSLYAPAVAQPVPTTYPTDLSSSFALSFGATPLATQTLTVKVQSSSGAALGNARVDVTAGPASVYLTGTSDATGTATFAVPAGAAYTVAVTGPGGVGAGQWTGSVTAATTATIRVA
jgi:type II secretory pathway pseudopilin PulG